MDDPKCRVTWEMQGGLEVSNKKMLINMDDRKCRVAWEMQSRLEDVGSLRIAVSWLAIKNVEKYR